MGEGRAKGKVLEATMLKAASLTTDQNPELRAGEVDTPLLSSPGPGSTPRSRDGRSRRAGCSLSHSLQPQKPALPIHGRGERERTARRSLLTADPRSAPARAEGTVVRDPDGGVRPRRQLGAAAPGFSHP